MITKLPRLHLPQPLVDVKFGNTLLLHDDQAILQLKSTINGKVKASFSY
ncbi:hypothetical protein [Orientia tsutsugamushi]|nr:hypothetical protein [Orientia tsutsugamushi]